MKQIALLDCNNFFVSCERLFRPDLSGKPVVVLSSNDGCVVARSQEVKDMGIPMGVPVFKVKKEFEEGGVVTFSSNFPLYRDISARVMNILRSEVEKMEQYSVDEAFFSVPVDVSPDVYIKGIKTIMEQKVGIPVSVGVADSKTLAKVANGIAKKGEGTFVLTKKDWDERAKEMHIGEIWGIGAGLSRKFVEQNLKTPADLMLADSASIAKIYRVVGTRLRSELRGEGVYKIEKKRAVQESVMSSRSFAQPEENVLKLEKALAYHVDQAMHSLREMEALCGSVSIHVQPSRFGDYALQGISASAQLEFPTDDTGVVLNAVLKCFRPLYKEGVPYKKAGVVLGTIAAKEGVTANLFDQEKIEDTDSLWSTVDALRAKFGKEVVSLYGSSAGSQLTSKKFNSGGQTTRWTDIPTVKAS